MPDWQKGRHRTSGLGQIAKFYGFIFEEELVC